MKQDSTNIPIDTRVPMYHAVPKRKPTKFRLRWNLLTLLLFTPVVASWWMVISIRRENTRLRAGIETMQAQSQRLHIKYPDRVAIVRLPEIWFGETRWEIALPSAEVVASGGTAYKLCLATKDIGGPRQAAPPASEFHLPPGRHRLELRIGRKQGKWRIVAMLDDKPVIENLESADWDPGHGGFSLGASMDQSYQPSDATTSVELHREVFSDSRHNGGFSRPDQPSNGVLMWLEPIKKD